jgi:hypothetical protein
VRSPRRPARVRHRTYLGLAGPGDVGHGAAGRHEGHAAEDAAVRGGDPELRGSGPLGRVPQFAQVGVALAEVEEAVVEIGVGRDVTEGLVLVW